MMLRATVVDVNPQDPTRVWVTIPQKYGAKPLRVFTRVQVTKGDHVYVANTSVTRVPQWVVFDQQTEVGTWGNPYPHTHPIGQVDGLVDWVKEYEAWAKDHAARLDAADKRIAEGKAEVDAARKDLTQAQTDIAEAVRKATLEQARLDQAEANLDQMGRNLTAAGGRISANETALAASQKRLDAAETTVQKTSKDLTALQGTVGDVQSKVAASDQKAADALAKAGAAQVSADGKTTITRALEPRTTQPGTAVGDTHFTMSSMGGGGRVVRQQRWDGSTWQDETVSHEVIASLDLGKATVGELDGGRIAARSLTSDRLVVGVSGNLIVDPNFNDATISSWRVAGRWRWDDSGTEKRFVAVSDGTLTTMTLNGGKAKTPSLPVTAGTTYTLILDMTGAAQVFLAIQYANGAVQTPGASIQAIPYSADRRRVALTVIPDNYDHASANGSKAVGILLNVRQPANAPVGTETAIYSAKFAPRTGTVLIEDGAITGEKVEAHSVSGAIGQFLKVEAQSGTFTDSLTGRNARLLGETVAESINITGKIRGRDAILTGTVDVDQLNVTGAMSAKIISTATLQARQGFFTDGLTAQDATLLGTTVAEKLVVTGTFSARVANAMDVNAKRLIVTDDAILNRATVVQSLVTPELISQKADIGDLASRMITSGLLQTDAAANRGVKINSAGIRAWDTSGNQTIRLDGTNNLVQGTFQTGTTGSRIKVDAVDTTAFIDLYGNSGGRDHGTIYYDAAVAGKTDAALTLTAMKDYSTNPTNPSFRLFPTRGTFAFQGVWAGNTDPLKFVVLQNSAGLPANAYATIRVPYTTPFPNVSSTTRIPVMSVESSTGADVMATIVSQTQTDITVNVVNKSSGKGSGTIIVKIATFVTDMQW